MKFHPMGTEIRADGQTETTKLIVLTRFFQRT